MSIGPIAGLAGSYLQSIIIPALRRAGFNLHNLEQHELQRLPQSNPSQYAQVTQQIAAKLQSAAQTAQVNGSTTAASGLNSLATDFTSASQNGQQPNVQDLTKAIGRAAAVDADCGTGSSVSSNTSGGGANSVSQITGQLFASLQTNATQSASADPASIILSTLSNAGPSGVNA